MKWFQEAVIPAASLSTCCLFTNSRSDRRNLARMPQSALAPRAKLLASKLQLARSG
jgi:hypothetical protein